MKLIALLATACLVAVPLSAAPAQTQKPTEAKPQSKSEGKAGSERICRRWTKTGTRLGQSRVCKTRAEWDDELFEMRSIINQTQANKRAIEDALGRQAFQNCLRC